MKITWNIIYTCLLVFAALANIGSFFLGFRKGKKRGRIEAIQEQDQNNNGNSQHQRQSFKL